MCEHHRAIQSKFLEKGCSVLDRKKLVFVPETLQVTNLDKLNDTN